MAKLINVLFGHTEAADDIKAIQALLDKAIMEHNIAAEKHRQSLELLKREVNLVERKRRNRE